MKIILCSDKKTAIKLKKAGFKFIKEDSGIYHFLFNKSIKFDFESNKSKLCFINKLIF